MRVLHTSDWHLGRSLFGQPRYDEFEKYLNWLHEEIVNRHIDVLIVAGDIFDVPSAPNRAQNMYYRFLARLGATPCRHVVVVGGNHDSGTLLDAPREVLKALNVHVVGEAIRNASGAVSPEDEVLVLRDGEERPELLVAAVPYLRDADVSTFAAGESFETTQEKVRKGIEVHYAAAARRVEEIRASLGEEIPAVATGHLCTKGGMTATGDGVRELRIGSLDGVDMSIFGEAFDYVALGHLHVPQKVAACEFVRYSGSPIPMGFGEAGQQKICCIVEFEGRRRVVSTCEIPRFRQLEHIEGDWPSIASRLKNLIAQQKEVWVEIVNTGDVMVDLREKIDSALCNSEIRCLRFMNSQNEREASLSVTSCASLDELDVETVFEKFLESKDNIWSEDDTKILWNCYRQIVREIGEADLRAE